MVNRDTDQDGILDWEEGLWGTDPTKRETTPGIPDSITIKKLSAQSGSAMGGKKIEQSTENLSETDKFSRELFATIAAGSQNGPMDPASIEALSTALAEKIQNPVIRKVFLLSDLNISVNDDRETVKNYGDALINIQKIYTVDYSVLDILQKFSMDENNVDVSVLTKLDPIIEQTNKIITAALKTSVPKSFSTLHLNVINSFERLSENLHDIQLFDTDVIVFLGAISQYNQNALTLESDMNNLQNAIQQKLNN